jgi:hypothetical protein
MGRIRIKGIILGNYWGVNGVKWSEIKGMEKGKKDDIKKLI